MTKLELKLLRRIRIRDGPYIGVDVSDFLRANRHRLHPKYARRIQSIEYSDLINRPEHVLLDKHLADTLRSSFPEWMVNHDSEVHKG